jgi:hypothetical protein
MSFASAGPNGTAFLGLAIPLIEFLGRAVILSSGPLAISDPAPVLHERISG